MGQRTTGAKNPFLARKIQYNQLSITCWWILIQWRLKRMPLMMGEKKALLMESEDWRAVEVLMTGKKDSAVDEEEAVDLTVAG
jgi:hypothetical protein